MPWVSATLTREALEEPLVDGVEEVLLLGEVSDGVGGAASMAR